MVTAIKVENLSKQYRLGLVSTRTVSHDLNRWWQMNILRKDDPYLKIGDTNIRSVKGQSEYIWALEDINLEVKEGEVLGIIGKNGAGKSTLLKILSKITSPTTGTVKARGRIASLLEVGTGFHQEMTGRENIFLNGAILGMTKTEIRKKFDDIVEFSGVERYIDTPVKRYSSGMTVRLGFAIAANLEPEILVVDEVLAVGDAEFQKKAIGKMQEVSKGQGRTVLFVSHNMASILNLCNSCVLLSNGQIIKSGEPSEVINYYLKAASYENLNRDYGVFDLTDRKNPYRSELIIRKVSLKDSNGLLTEKFQIGEGILIEINVSGFNKYPNALIGVIFKSPEGQWITSLNTGMVKPKIPEKRFEQEIIMLRIPKLLLTENIYTLDISVTIQGVGRLDYVENLITIDIVDADYYGEGYKVNKYFGTFCLEGEWHFN